MVKSLGLLKKNRIKWERDRGVFKKYQEDTGKATDSGARAKSQPARAGGSGASQGHPPGGLKPKSIDGLKGPMAKPVKKAVKKTVKAAKKTVKAAAKAVEKTRQKMVGRYQTSAREKVMSRSGPGKVKAAPKRKVGQSLRLQ